MKRRKKIEVVPPHLMGLVTKSYNGEEETESRGGKIQEGSEQERRRAYEERQARCESSELSCQGETGESGW